MVPCSLVPCCLVALLPYYRERCLAESANQMEGENSSKNRKEAPLHTNDLQTSAIPPFHPFPVKNPYNAPLNHGRPLGEKLPGTAAPRPGFRRPRRCQWRRSRRRTRRRLRGPRPRRRRRLLPAEHVHVQRYVFPRPRSRLTVPSRRRPPRHQVHARRRRQEGHLRRGHTSAHPLLRDAHHLRRAREAAQRRLPDGHQGPADGQHHLPRAVAPAHGRPAPDLPHPRPGLRRARAALHRQRGAQERRRPVQREPAHHPARERQPAGEGQPRAPRGAVQHPPRRRFSDGKHLLFSFGLL